MIHPLRRHTYRNPLSFFGGRLALLVVLVLVLLWTRPDDVPTEPPMLPPIRAVGIQTDTLFLGGYTRGSFEEAVRVLNSELTPPEREMIGRHLDKMFAGILKDGVGKTGRLRLAYERSRRPDGTTRAIRVLAAEVAAGGTLHKAFFYEHERTPGYFDVLGRSLGAQGMMRPLERARVTSPFNTQRLHPILRRVIPHAGTDYAAAPGTPVRAAADGSVAFSGPRGGYGNLVEILHPNGYSTRYAHLSRVQSGIAPGSGVRRGETVGYVGMTGLATGPHLHYELRCRGRPVDPEAFATEGVPALDVGFTQGWSTEHRKLAGLLARAPTLLTVGPSPGTR